MKTQKATAGARMDAAAPALGASRTGAMRVRKFIAIIWIDAVSLVIIAIVFIVPFVFILLTAAKTEQEAALFEFSWPSPFQLAQNIRDVVTYSDNRMLLALWNSALLTVG